MTGRLALLRGVTAVAGIGFVVWRIWRIGRHAQPIPGLAMALARLIRDRRA